MGQIHHLGRATATAEVGMALGRPLARRDAVSGRTVAGRALGRHAARSGAARVAGGGVGRDSGHGASKLSGVTIFLRLCYSSPFFGYDA